MILSLRSTYHFLKTTTMQFVADGIMVHLAVTLVSLPILIMWGLPFSLAASIGNIAFTPLLACFLAISSLIFFTELLFIPNAMLISLLSTLASSGEYSVKAV